MRRLVDTAFAILCLILIAPFGLVISLLIKLESQGPVLYAPRMMGQHGREFRLFRFRTMKHVRSDVQPTRVGSFIRNYSLDHLPQLINLLTGDLTLVGPRPMEVHLVDLQDPIWLDYFRSKPGLFNYAVLKLGKAWTPSRHTDPSLNQELELNYARKRSPWLDVKVLLAFLREFIRSKGNVKARGRTDSER